MTAYKFTIWCESGAAEADLAAALEQGRLWAVASDVQYRIDPVDGQGARVWGPTCPACGTERPPDAWRHGWRGPHCRACHERWTYHGRPEGGPPPAKRPAPGTREGRLEDYAELRAQGVSLKEAARRLGVSRGTAGRYSAVLRERRTGRPVT